MKNIVEQLYSPGLISRKSILNNFILPPIAIRKSSRTKIFNIWMRQDFKNLICDSIYLSGYIWKDDKIIGSLKIQRIRNIKYWQCLDILKDGKC